jgi:hypothetical protein
LPSGKARGHLYSTAAVNSYCQEAQKIIAGTSLESINVLQAKSLPVARILPPFLPVPPQKRGVHYCHLPSAEYLRLLLTGEVRP